MRRSAFVVAALAVAGVVDSGPSGSGFIVGFMIGIVVVVVPVVLALGTVAVPIVITYLY